MLDVLRQINKNESDLEKLKAQETPISGSASSTAFFTGSNTTGSTIAANKAVASNGGATLIKLADSGTTNDFAVIGFTTASIANGASGQVQIEGVLAGFSGLTPFARYFSDPATPGGITSTPPTTTSAKYQVVGVAINSTTLALEIQPRIRLNVTTTQARFVALNGGLLIDTPVVVTPGTNDLGAVALQAATPGTQQTGNANISGKLITGGDIASSGDISGVNVTGSGTVQGATVTSTGAVNAATAFNRNGIAMNNVVVLDKVCRVLSDGTSRASGYSNSAVAVAGATDLVSSWITLPATLKAVWYSFFVLTAAAAGVGVVVENPSFVVGASTMRGTTVQQSGGGNFAYSGGGVVSLNSSGQLRYVLSGTANITTTIIDIWAYSV